MLDRSGTGSGDAGLTGKGAGLVIINGFRRNWQFEMAIDILKTGSTSEIGIDALGRRIRQLRKKQERTLESLAHEVGLTKGYLSKVETGRQTPPTATLSKLAKALGTDIETLVENNAVEDVEPEHETASVVRVDERRNIIRATTSFGYDYQSLVSDAAGKHMSPLLVSFPSQAPSGMVSEHGSEAMMFVLSGVVEFEVGQETFELQPGDCIYFNRRERHRGRSKSGEAKALVVLCEPKNCR